MDKWYVEELHIGGEEAMFDRCWDESGVCRFQRGEGTEVDKLTELVLLAFADRLLPG
jgi:hypothetical protein